MLGARVCIQSHTQTHTHTHAHTHTQRERERERERCICMCMYIIHAHPHTHTHTRIDTRANMHIYMEQVACAVPDDCLAVLQGGLHHSFALLGRCRASRQPGNRFTDFLFVCIFVCSVSLSMCGGGYMHWCVFCVLCVSTCVSSAEMHTHSFVSPRTPHPQVLYLGGGPANVSNISRMHVLAPVADMVLAACVVYVVLV